MTGAIIAATVALGLLAATPAHAFENGAQLLDGCQRFERGMKILSNKSIEPPRDSQAIICWGYILAMQEMFSNPELAMGACPPPQSTATQLLRTVIKHARGHPELLRQKATVVIMTALRSAYPCGSNI